MYTRTTSVLVGDGTNSALYSALTTANIAAGDLAVINKFGTVLQAGATPSSAVGNDEIKIIQGLATGQAKKSNIIQARGITKYTVSTYAAPVQQVSTVGSNGTNGQILASNSYRYKLRIEFKSSVNILPNQAWAYEVYYDSDASATQLEIATALAAKVNADRNLSVLVTAAVLTETTNNGISITAKAVPADTYGINRFEFVTFDVFFSKAPIDSTVVGSPVYVAGGEGATAGSTGVRVLTTPVVGKGTYAQVLDLYKDAIGDTEGYRNFILFPVDALPAGGPVAGATYDLISIEHFNHHPGPGIHNEGKTPELTVIAVPTGSAQATALLAMLSPYMLAIGLILS